MMTPEQLDNWFTYHAPTEETAPKYASIRKAEEGAVAIVVGALGSEDSLPSRYARVNAAARSFAEVIDANAPDSADKTAAIRCVRIMRNAANEALTVAEGQADPDHINGLVMVVVTEAMKARWQSNSAIACGGK